MTMTEFDITRLVGIAFLVAAVAVILAMAVLGANPRARLYSLLGLLGFLLLGIVGAGMIVY